MEVLLNFGASAVQATPEGHLAIDLAAHFDNLDFVEASLLARSPPGWEKRKGAD